MQEHTARPESSVQLATESLCVHTPPLLILTRSGRISCRAANLRLCPPATFVLPLPERRRAGEGAVVAAGRLRRLPHGKRFLRVGRNDEKDEGRGGEDEGCRGRRSFGTTFGRLRMRGWGADGTEGVGRTPRSGSRRNRARCFDRSNETEIRQAGRRWRRRFEW